MGTDENGRLDSAEVASLFVSCSDALSRYLRGILHDEQSAADVMQLAFAKLIERGRETDPKRREAWLYRVATNEALAVLRKRRTDRRILSEAAHTRPDAQGETSESPASAAVHRESIQMVRERLSELPPEQRTVVRKRIYENKKFQEIADELDIPLGTVLTRMRSALAKIRRDIHQAEAEPKTAENNPPSENST